MSSSESTGTSKDSFGARGTLEVGGRSYQLFRLSAIDGAQALPFSLKVLLENLLRTEDGTRVATHSTWWVIGKRSKARSPARR